MTDESTDTGPRSVEREKLEEDPGVFDWSYDVEETSVWPFVSASGVGTMYLGAAVVMLTFETDQLLPRWPGLILFLAGMGGFVTGLFASGFFGLAGLHGLHVTLGVPGPDEHVSNPPHRHGDLSPLLRRILRNGPLEDAGDGQSRQSGAIPAVAPRAETRRFGEFRQRFREERHHGVGIDVKRHPK
jgi:hypothetical protein